MDEVDAIQALLEELQSEVTTIEAEVVKRGASPAEALRDVAHIRKSLEVLLGR
jgi:hypothetical protein